jgi:hypothetical protein
MLVYANKYHHKNLQASYGDHMKFSSIPIIFALICAFWVWAARASVRRQEITGMHLHAIYAWLALLGLWGVVTAWLALSGAYLTEYFYAVVPGMWVPLAPVMLSLALLALWPALRHAVWQVTKYTTPQAFFFLHAIRIASIGGIIKAANGFLPQSFVYPIGIPDMLFGLLSLALAITYPSRGYSSKVLIGWNVLGMAVLMSAPVFMQLGLPGPLYIFNSVPDARSLFEFPMVLAPTLVVTLLFFINGLHAWVLWRSGLVYVSHAISANTTSSN